MRRGVVALAALCSSASMASPAAPDWSHTLHSTLGMKAEILVS